MKLIVQRVTKASVTVKNQLISSIENGYLVYVGINVDDKIEDVELAGKKLLNLKSFDKENTQDTVVTVIGWAENIKIKNYPILCISQFTLNARLKSNKPDFCKSMPSKDSLILYQNFLNFLKTHYNHDQIYDGKFGEYMLVESINDGPCTFIIDTSIL